MARYPSLGPIFTASRDRRGQFRAHPSAETLSGINRTVSRAEFSVGEVINDGERHAQRGLLAVVQASARSRVKRLSPLAAWTLSRRRIGSLAAHRCPQGTGVFLDDVSVRR